jgi:putative spermidine/putrescine transport system ATP-binding protein
VDNGQFVTTQGERIVVNTATPHATTLGIRPERLRLASAPESSEMSIPVTLAHKIYLGSTVELRLTSERGQNLVALVPNTARAGTGWSAGDTLHACFRTEDCLLFSA